MLLDSTSCGIEVQAVTHFSPSRATNNADSTSPSWPVGNPRARWERKSKEVAKATNGWRPNIMMNSAWMVHGVRPCLGRRLQTYKYCWIPSSRGGSF